MKIAITSSGNEMDSEMDPRFGRCPYYAIINIEDNKIISTEFMKNIAAEQMGGAGIKAGNNMADKKVDVVITGNIGPNAMNVLQANNIKIRHASGKIKDVIQNVIDGKLDEINESVAPHSGMNR